MNRKEFLSQLGLGAAGVVVFGCLSGCSKSSISGPSNVNFNLDLSSPSNTALLQNGGYLYSNGLIVAKTMTGGYIAVSQACTHQGATLIYDNTNDILFCPAHGSAFNDNGSVKHGPANSPLKQYVVTVNGNVLTISG
jgi:cytochrome b6-f complex iron-sulfur subunit